MPIISEDHIGPPRPKLGLILLLLLLTFVFIAGGASRADAIGQAVVRTAAWSTMIMAVLFLRPAGHAGLRIPALLLIAMIALAALQLVPLPPSLWSSLPGRGAFREAGTMIGTVQPWRPIALSPAATLNALGSLIVPAACLAALAGIAERQHRTVLLCLFLAILGSALLGIFQVSGAAFDHPMVNDVRGEISGSFANRNHFALFLALGCAAAPSLAALQGSWRKPAAVAAVAAIPVLLLLILATGSRTGLAVGLVGTIGGGLVARRWIGMQLASVSRWAAIAVTGGFLLVLVGAVTGSLIFDRAASVDRVLAIQDAEDLRGLIRPTVLGMIETYFPIGVGFGNFDAAYRIDEPAELLRFSYVNQAHNDLLSVALEGGLAGLVILMVAMWWLIKSSIRAWRTSGAMLARLGSVMILLVVLASATDYPARTPMIMAVLAIAASWLARIGADGPEPPRRRS